MTTDDDDDDDRMREKALLLCNAMNAIKRGGLHWVDNTQRSKVLSNAYPKTCESRPAKGGVGLFEWLMRWYKLTIKESKCSWTRMHVCIKQNKSLEGRI